MRVIIVILSFVFMSLFCDLFPNIPSDTDRDAIVIISAILCLYGFLLDALDVIAKFKAKKINAIIK